jgi:hypothetical protein
MAVSVQSVRKFYKQDECKVQPEITGGRCEMVVVLGDS